MSNFKSTYNQFKKYNSKPVIIKKEFVIKDNDFPDLASQLDNSNISNKNNSKNNNVMSFASLLKKVETPDIVKYDDDEIIPDGWSCYKYKKYKSVMCGDKNSEVTIKKKSQPQQQPKSDIKPVVILNEAAEIINALSILHEKRTNEHKQLWGEDEWERMFICPYYDCDYFNKLDEALENEENKLNEEYNEDYDSY